MEKNLGTLYLEKRLGTNPPSLTANQARDYLHFILWDFLLALKITKDKNDLPNLLIYIHVISFFGGNYLKSLVQMFLLSYLNELKIRITLE